MLEVWFFFAPFFSLPDSGLHPDANREYRYMKKSRNLKVFCSENPSVLFFNIKKKKFYYSYSLFWTHFPLLQDGYTNLFTFISG